MTCQMVSANSQTATCAHLTLCWSGWSGWSPTQVRPISPRRGLPTLGKEDASGGAFRRQKISDIEGF